MLLLLRTETSFGVEGSIILVPISIYCVGSIGFPADDPPDGRSEADRSPQLLLGSTAER